MLIRSTRFVLIYYILCGVIAIALPDSHFHISVLTCLCPCNSNVLYVLILILTRSRNWNRIHFRIAFFWLTASYNPMAIKYEHSNVQLTLTKTDMTNQCQDECREEKQMCACTVHLLTSKTGYIVRPAYVSNCIECAEEKKRQESRLSKP